MCAIDGADDTFEWSRTTRPKARKSYKCDECCRDIAPGEVYHRCVGKFDGRLDVYIMCRHCDEASRILVRECHGFLYHGIREDLQEHIDSHYDWAMEAARAVVGIKRKWRSFRGEGLLPLPRVKLVPEKNQSPLVPLDNTQ